MQEIVLALIRDTAGSFAVMVVGVVGAVMFTLAFLRVERNGERREARRHVLQMAEHEAARTTIEHHPEPPT